MISIELLKNEGAVLKTKSAVLLLLWECIKWGVEEGLRHARKRLKEGEFA